MQLITETYDRPLKVLVVSSKETLFTSILKKQLEEMKVQIFSSSKGNEDYSKFDVLFFVDYPEIIPSEFLDSQDQKIIFVFFDDAKNSEAFSSFSYQHNLKNIKVINAQTKPEHFEKDVETILWFAFSRTNDIFLHIYHQKKEQHKKPKQKKPKPTFSFKKLLDPTNLIAIGIVFLIATHIIFIPPLLLASYFHYSAAKSILNQDFDSAKGKLQRASSTLQASQSLYSFPKSTLHFFSLAFLPENILQINTSINKTLSTAIQLRENGIYLAELISIKDKTELEITELYTAKERIIEDIDILDSQILYLEEKIPEWTPELVTFKKQLADAEGSIEHIKELTPHLDSIFAKGAEKKYLLLFGNNMELRPGGGFIGSFAIVKVSDYTITDMQLYDVYDADGQLKEQIDPPQPIVDYLNQTHFFLRDSAFKPDFITNLAEANKFLQLELNETDFDGAIFFTTTAAQNVLAAFDNLYIPDFQENVTPDNFYIKAQLYAEEDFFPGSRQKKEFLSSVMNQILLNLPNATFPELMKMVEKSLNEKQIVFYMEDKTVQDFIEENYWAGRTLIPKCNLDDAYNCVLDYVFPFDANLGVNKTNFFIQRPTNLDISIDDKGNIVNKLRIEYNNTSYPDVFPGGTYKNYFQTYFPPNTRIESIRVEDNQIDQYDETNFEYKTVGFLLEVPPQESRVVEIEYTLPTTIISGEGLYQLIFQKQIGSPNYDFGLTFTFPNNITIKNKNFSPLVKGNEMIYNTQISSDKIFVIEFSKK